MALVRTITDDSEPFDVAAAKQQLRETLIDEDNDAFIESLIPVVRRAAEDRTARTLVPSTYRLTLGGFFEVLVLEKGPVTEVSSVQYYDTAGDLQTLATDQYEADLDSMPARIVPAYGVTWPATRSGKPGAVIVSYAAGYADPADIPPPIVHWMKLALTDLYHNRARSSDKPVVAQDFADDLLANGHTTWSP